MKLLILPLFFSLAGCASKVLITGKVYPPTNHENIILFAQQKPNCHLVEIGMITTNVEWNQEAAVKEAKIKAAEIGATHLNIVDIKRNAFNDAAVKAVAFRCNE